MPQSVASLFLFYENYTVAWTIKKYFYDEYTILYDNNIILYCLVYVQMVKCSQSFKIA